jgi:hypothetical protein
MVKVLIGIILLSDISIRPAYQEVFQSGVARAGLSPINASLVDISGFDTVATASFWWSFPSLMTNTAEIATIPPLTCSGSSCLSYFLPGPITLLLFDEALPMIETSDFQEADVLIVNDAPGYQLEFSQPTGNDSKLNLNTDCRPYGISWAMIIICIKKVGNSLIGGI